MFRTRTQQTRAGFSSATPPKPHVGRILLALSLAAGCVSAPATEDGHAATWGTAVDHDGPKNDVFRRVSDETGVPIEAMMTLAYLQGRFEEPLPAEFAGVDAPAVMEPAGDASSEATMGDDPWGPENDPWAPEDPHAVLEDVGFQPEGATGLMHLSPDQCEAAALALREADEASCSNMESSVRFAAQLMLGALENRGASPVEATESDWEEALVAVLTGAGVTESDLADRVRFSLRAGFDAVTADGEYFEIQPAEPDHDVDFGAASDELVIPGRWALSGAAVNASRGVRMGYEGAPPWNGGRNCGGSLLAGTRQLGDYIRANYRGRVSSYGGYSCRPNTANRSQTSVHGTGRALDLFVPLDRGQADNGRGDIVANWLVQNAQAIGVQLVIWDRTIWSTGTGGGRISGYGGPHPHHDHIHVELTRAGAARNTPWFRPRTCSLGGGIASKYNSVNGPALLGRCVNGEHPTPDGMGAYAHFERGSIYWSRRTGNAQVVRGAIRDRWRELGWERGRLGYPTSDERPTPDGRGAYTHFERGSIYWSREHGAHQVWGDIHRKWSSEGWESSRLGYPVTGEKGTPDGRAAYNHFEHGSIYWTREHGSHAVYNAIRNKWRDLGWERSRLGYPIADEQPTADGRGAFSRFERGSIYWSREHGTHAIAHGIHDKWLALGALDSRLGFPTTDERATPDGRGAYNHFEHGSIYWSREHGAFAVLNAIHSKWRDSGWEGGPLGYPTSDETDAGDGRGAYSLFEKGSIHWSPEHGAHAVHGAIYELWESLGAEGGDLGYPTSDEMADGGARYVEFEAGSIRWEPGRGAFVVPGAGS